MKPFHLAHIPLPPSQNNAYPTNRQGRRFKSQKYRMWLNLFTKWQYEHWNDVQILKREFGQIRLGHYIQIDTVFYFHRPTILCATGLPKRNDTSNRLKILYDAVAEMLTIDDCFFFDGSFYKRLNESESNIQEYCNIDLQWVSAEWMNVLNSNVEPE